MLRLYDLSEGGTEVYAEGYDICSDLGLSRQDAERIVRYHEDHGYITNTSGVGLSVRITARGIDAVEAGLPG